MPPHDESNDPGRIRGPGIELAAVANRTKESGERVAREFGIARVYDDWRDLVRAPDVDAICIGTWPNVNALRGHEKVTRTTFDDGVRYMEFTDAVARSAASGQAVEVRDL